MEKKYQENNFWHPLYKYIKQVKEAFIKEKGVSNFLDTFNFRFYLDCLKDKEEYKELVDIFTPLNITCYKNLVLFKYKGYIELEELGYNLSNFFDLYDGLYLYCRSIVYNIDTLEVVLASLDKFKNYGEDGDKWSQESIWDKYKNSKNIEITNKLDGSYQQYRWYNGEVVGSGSSALDPLISWRLKKGYSFLDENYLKLLKENPDYTFIFEFISPDNQIVVFYPENQQGLYLLAARNVYNGKELSYKKLIELSKKYNIKITIIYQETLNSILNQLDNYTSNEKEGWVVRLDNNFRFKIKITDYVLIHKALSKIISPNAIIQAYADNRFDDFFSKIPVAYRDTVMKTKEYIANYISLVNKNTKDWYQRVNLFLKQNELENNTKNFMIAVDKLVPKKYQGFVRNIYLNKPLSIIKKAKGRYIKLKDIKEELNIKD